MWEKGLFGRTMLTSYFSVNFIALMILFAMLVLMYVNKDVEIPGTNFFVMGEIGMVALTFVRWMNVIAMPFYLLLCLYGAIRALYNHNKRKSFVFIVIFIQCVLAFILRYLTIDSVDYFNEIMALGLLEYYIYLAVVYRKELHEKLDNYVEEVEDTSNKLKSLTSEVIEALASAIDAKDTYTHGHASRVAEYSRKLAEMHGKSKQECDEIYYAALLHDVGKIGVSDNIITKNGKLTEEEYEQIKKHTVLGTQILQQISEFPYLSTGAVSHHERYDGTGYPTGMKGTDIPEIARIISVADAYDAMSSKRSYRDPIPQQIVREEIAKGIGTQFDPEYARLMLHLIDVDTDYEMSEREEGKELSKGEDLVSDEYRSEISPGILLTSAMTTIRMKVTALEKTSGKPPIVSLILFDSLDSRVHELESEINRLDYFEYGEIWLDGRSIASGARKIQVTKKDYDSSKIVSDDEYQMEAVKIKDHALLRIIGNSQILEAIVALPDNARFLYVGLTGENCRISDFSIDKAQEDSPANLIPRIAEEISYIDVPAGDIPNVQIDGYRTDASLGVEARDGLKLSFHTRSLPTARLIWHCPFIDIFCSADGKVNGKKFRDLAFLRLDGESWAYDPDCKMILNGKRLDTFIGWDEWKEFCKAGFDAEVTFEVKDNEITVITENAGIALRNTVVLPELDRKVYVAITGDQVAITNIRIS